MQEQLRVPESAGSCNPLGCWGQLSREKSSDDHCVRLSQGAMPAFANLDPTAVLGGEPPQESPVAHRDLAHDWLGRIVILMAKPGDHRISV